MRFDLRSRRRQGRYLPVGRMLLALMAVVLWLGTAWGLIREGAIPGRAGLSFHRLTYRFGYLDVSVTNGTGQNVIFGGSMVFLDRHYRPVARAELLPESIKRRSTRRYRAVFVEGSGHEAADASFLVWEFNQRNN
ncbi:MAG: hypothetical protein IJU98_09170 [Synergistaceae bacterium]|nr:hypothetical protein [Synergistaceae bacterium]